MTLKLIYQVFAKLLSWMVVCTRSEAAKEIEMLVLRHQLSVLHRRQPRPRISWTDRAVIAALARLLPPHRRLGLLVTPSTILRWHRRLVHRRLTIPHARPGRPAIPAGVRALIVRLATHNPSVALSRLAVQDATATAGRLFIAEFTARGAAAGAAPLSLPSAVRMVRQRVGVALLVGPGQRVEVGVDRCPRLQPGSLRGWP